MFKISRDLLHGTVNFEFQIANNLQLKKNNKVNLDDLFKSTLNSNIKLFISENFIKNKIETHNRILNPQNIIVNLLETHEKELLIRL